MSLWLWLRDAFGLPMKGSWASADDLAESVARWDAYVAGTLGDRCPCCGAEIDGGCTGQ